SRSPSSKTLARRPASASLGGFGDKKEAGGPLVFGQIDSRSALAAACRRSLTSASSRAARSMRSCWTSVRSCWLLARSCWRSARSRTSLSWLASSSTVRVRSASCPATLAMSCSAVTPSYPILRGETRRGGQAAPPPLLRRGRLRSAAHGRGRRVPLDRGDDAQRSRLVGVHLCPPDEVAARPLTQDRQS